MVRKLNKISVWSHLKLRLSGKSKSGLIIYKGCGLEISKTSSFQKNGPGSLELNKKWSNKDPFKTLLSMGEMAKLTLNGSFSIFSGSRIYINQNAELSLGSGYINHGLTISVFESISIGNNVAISENVSIRDSDNHRLIDSTGQTTAPIKIGNHVWIGMNVTILKGTEIGDNSVIAAGAVVSGKFPPNCLIAGVPGKVIRENINWA
jgi:acetyltransferase-like isoleucine patch superfamily enzyme